MVAGLPNSGVHTDAKGGVLITEAWGVARCGATDAADVSRREVPLRCRFAAYSTEQASV